MIEPLTNTKGLEHTTEEQIARLAHLGVHDHGLARNLFPMQKDLDLILDALEQRQSIIMYTGVGPSGELHLGHAMVMRLISDLQRIIPKLRFMLADDEKYLTRDLTIEQIQGFKESNRSFLRRFGFDLRTIQFLSTTENLSTTYAAAIRVSRLITMNQIRSTFGRTTGSNIGEIFYPAIQIAPCFFDADESSAPLILVICGLDQYPYFQLARDLSDRLGFPKPAVLVGYPPLPSLIRRNEKMSSSVPSSAIFLTDSPSEINQKITRAITTGGETRELHALYGGTPEACPVFRIFEAVTEQDDEALETRRIGCSNGTLSCRDCKNQLKVQVIEYITVLQG